MLSSYLFRKVLRVAAFSIRDNELLGQMTLFNNVNFTNGSETTDVTAGGVVIAQLDHSKVAGLNGESPLITDTILALQSGATIETLINTSLIAVPDTITINDNTGRAKYGGTGAVGTEVRFAYLLDGNGNPVKTFRQAETTEVEGTFTYANATRTLTFADDAIENGSKVLIYTYPRIQTAKVITNDSNKFSTSARILCDIAVADPCAPDEEFLMRIVFENGKFSGTYEWSIDGINPAVQSWEISSMLPCGETKLWDAFIFDEKDILVTEA